jgi:glycosyltransferase involved in cell wall biosynthesis
MLNVLIWRSFIPLHAFPATFYCLSEHGIGGTDTQLLWHARTLAELNYRVQVLGVSEIDVNEFGIEFVGSKTKVDQEKLLASGRIRTPDVVLLEGGVDAAPLFRELFPKAKIIHIGQNIDNGGHRNAFQYWEHIDGYAFVGLGQYADHCQRYHQLRHKFLLVRNIVPWRWIYADLRVEPVGDEIIWVGSWSKKGLRRWAEVMQNILRDFPTYSWILYGPSYGSGHGDLPTHVFKGLTLPLERVHVRSLPMAELFQKLGRARLILVSLGNETASISTLDAHAASRPVISGNDMTYKYANPEGTGIRVTSRLQCEFAIRYLLRDPNLCDDLGKRGHRLIIDEYTEVNQRRDLELAIDYLLIKDRIGPLANFSARSHSDLKREDLWLRVQRKWLAYSR